MQRIYFFSGMGADHQAFAYLQLPNTTPVYCDWIEPLENENLKDYAMRLVADKPPEPDDILIGLSMGGFIAQEVAAVYDVKMVILLSSLRSGESLRPLFTAAEKLNLSHFLIPDLLKKTIVAGAKLVLPLRKERIKLIFDMLDKYDGAYYKWAINQVLLWQGVFVKCPVRHIHGDKDEIFPIARVKDAVIVPGGTHLMVVTKPKEISEIMRSFIAEV